MAGRNKTFFLRLAALFCALTLCLPLLAACSPGSSSLQKHEVLDCFDTVCYLYMVPVDDDAWSFAVTVFEDELRKYHRLCDRFHEYEDTVNVAALNRLAGGEPTEVSPALYDLLVFGKEATEGTNGAMNILVGSLTDLWRKTADAVGNAKDADASFLPTDAQIADAKEHIPIDSLVLSGGTVEITDERAQIDLGAIAKGYVCDKITKRLQASGYHDFIVNLGGTVRTDGKKADGSAFRVGFDESVKAEKDSFALTDSATATSSQTYRSFTIDGKTYGHLIDVRTGRPAERFASVSVISESAALCDVLSTALFTVTEEEGKEILSALSVPADVLWCYPDGRTSATAGFFS